jgi:hypothetical protein
VLDASNCCLSDAAGLRVAALIRAQAAAAAQVAWAKTLRTGASSSSKCRSAGRHRDGSSSCRDPHRSERGWTGCSRPAKDPSDIVLTQLSAVAASGFAGVPVVEGGGVQVLDLSNNQVGSGTMFRSSDVESSSSCTGIQQMCILM